MPADDPSPPASVPFSRFRALLATVALPTIIGVFCACDPVPQPLIINLPAGDITVTTATLGGEVVDENVNGDTERGIVYSRVVDDSTPSYEENETVVTLEDDAKGAGVFSIDVTGLEPATDYVFRAWADNGTIGYSAPEYFTTAPGVAGGESFDVDGSEIRAIAVQPDGKILVGGSFESIAGEDALNLARLHPDGSIDTTFSAEIDQPDYGGFVNAIAVQDDGKIIIGGYFDHINGEGSSTVNVSIARLKPDGQRDPSFVATTYYGNVFCLSNESDGSILVGGALVVRQGFHGFRDLFRLSTMGQSPFLHPGDRGDGPTGGNPPRAEKQNSKRIHAKAPWRFPGTMAMEG